jgi:dolichol-phosphate mannosyltransferase
MGSAVQGWTSTMLVVVFLGAVQMFVLGMIGEYLGRLYVESKRRPLYLVADVAGPVKGHASLGYRYADSGEVTVSPHAPARAELAEPDAIKAKAPRRKPVASDAETAEPPTLL